MILGAMSSLNRPKFVVVVDDDIDVFDHIEVLWAISTRVRPADDVIIIPNFNTGALDPSFSQHELGSALGIDATRPFGKPFGEVPTFRGNGPRSRLAGDDADRKSVTERTSVPCHITEQTRRRKEPLTCPRI